MSTETTETPSIDEAVARLEQAADTGILQRYDEREDSLADGHPYFVPEAGRVYLDPDGLLSVDFIAGHANEDGDFEVTNHEIGHAPEGTYESLRGRLGERS